MTRALTLSLLAFISLANDSRAQGGSGDSLLLAGRFADAERALLARYAADSTDYEAALRLGRIALYGNRFAAADRWLNRAIALRPTEPPPKLLLAEALVRRDDFTAAAPLLRAANRAQRAEKLESFGAARPNELVASTDETRLPFVLTDPLPIVRASINGRDSLYFILDTGGGELILDSIVASSVGAVRMGTNMGMFAGGQAPVTDGRVDSVRLGDFTLHRVPVRIMNARQTGTAVGHRVDGIIGTVLLYHFLATIDYPNNQLVLRRRTPDVVRRFQNDATARGSEVVPMWLAGDHFTFAWGRVNGRPPVLLFVDTGLAGGGFVASDSTALSLGINLSNTQTGTGVGGAGPTQVTWFTVDSIAMGNKVGRNIRGAIGTIRFRETFGFDAAGIVSHAFFRPYALTFDFDGMRMFLTP
jgi:aspartyl protease